MPVDAFKPVPPFADARIPVMLAAGSVNEAAEKVPVTVRLPGTRTVSAARPRTIESLLLTTAPEPTAVANVRVPAPTFASAPSSVFDVPVVFEVPVLSPTNVFELPVVAVSAPTKTLLMPVVENTRFPPILYCVVELTVFAEKSPPTVPAPLILKLLED